jgi:hypothetical protein
MSMAGMRTRLIPRWNCILGNINFFLSILEELIPGIEKSRGPGRPVKHPMKQYLMLIITKEFKRASLRDAETDYSKLICKRRIDHSVIHYWEKRISKELIQELIRLVGAKLDDLLGYDFSVIDATKFADWHKTTTEFHLLARIASETVYPASVYFGTTNPSHATKETLVNGSGYLLADPWYDDNQAIKLMFRAGYKPLVKPQRSRCRGYWRRKARKLYNLYWYKYRQRGRGESPFGSLTDEFGDRLKTLRHDTTQIRSGARILVYQVKIYMRGRLNYNMPIWMNN